MQRLINSKTTLLRYGLMVTLGLWGCAISAPQILVDSNSTNGTPASALPTAKPSVSFIETTPSPNVASATGSTSSSEKIAELIAKLATSKATNPDDAKTKELQAEIEKLKAQLNQASSSPPRPVSLASPSPTGRTPISTPISTPAASPSSVAAPSAAPISAISDPSAASPSLGVTASASPVPASKLLFTAFINNDFDLFLMNPEMSGTPENLTKSPEQDSLASWSPDGRQMAFQSRRDGDYEIYLLPVPPGSATPTKLTDNIFNDVDVAWSPTGSKLAFASDRTGNFDVYIMNVDGTEVQNVSNNPGQDSSPGWSSDGSKLVFASNRDGNFEIYTLNHDGSNLQRLTQNSSSDLFPAWSPDGRLIAWVSNRDSNDEEIYVMNVDGSNPRRLTERLGSDSFPAWLPDNQRLIFSATQNNQINLYLLDIVSKAVTPVTTGNNQYTFPKWVQER